MLSLQVCAVLREVGGMDAIALQFYRSTSRGRMR